MRFTARGMMPASELSVSMQPSGRFGPSIVYVLPVPVWPYANTVHEKPRSTSSTTGATDVVNSCSCVVVSPNARSSAGVGEG